MNEGIGNNRRSELYNKHKADIAKHVEWMDDQRVENYGDLERLLLSEFAILPRDDGTVQREDKEDVINFAEYASEQLSAGVVSSPIYREDMGSPDREIRAEALREGASGGYHDILHAMIAYQRSSGQSLVPAYLRVESKEAQRTDIAAIQEELMVDLWEAAGNLFLRELVTTGDAMLALDESIHSKEVIDKIYRPRVHALEAIRGSDPIGYMLGVYEAYFTLLQLAVSEGMEASVEDAMLWISTHRDPEYVKIATLIHKRLSGEDPNPRYLLDEFQSILAPLLARLRMKQEKLDQAA